MRIGIILKARILRRPRLFALWVRACVHSLAMIDRWLVEAGDVPPLYKSGVRFRREPKGVETFRDAKDVWARGHGDCAHLAAWRCGELQAMGEAARLRIKWGWRRGNPRLFHVLVRRADGRIEDPSRKLGMGRKRIRR
jgi:hypothetical protein